MVIVPFVALAAAAVMTACEIYDVSITEKGLKAGVGVESNDWLVGPKPSAVALYFRDLIFNVPLGYLPAGAVAFSNTWAATPFLVAPLLIGYKHIRGAKTWKTLLAGGKLPDPGSLSAWQKFWQG